MNDDTLVRMANQIAAFYLSYPAEEARAGGPGLDPIARDAAQRLAQDTAA